MLYWVSVQLSAWYGQVVCIVKYADIPSDNGNPDAKYTLKYMYIWMVYRIMF